MFIKLNEVVVDVMIDATWIWDAQLCRMDWANKEGLAFIGLGSLASLQKIRYNSNLPWVQQLNTLSETVLPETGGMEKISFPDGGVLNCWVKNHRTEEGHKGLWIILKEGQSVVVNVTDVKAAVLKNPKEINASLSLKDEMTARPEIEIKTSTNQKAPTDQLRSDRLERSAQEQEKSESGKILALIARQINAKTGDSFKKVRLPQTATSAEGVLAVQDNNVSVTRQEGETGNSENRNAQDGQKPGGGLPGMAELVKQMKRVEAVPVNDNEAAVSPSAKLQEDGAEPALIQTASNSEGIQDAVLVSGAGDRFLPGNQTRKRELESQEQELGETLATQHLPESGGLPVASAIVDEEGSFNAASELFALALGYHNEDDLLKNAGLEKVLPQVYQTLVSQGAGAQQSQLFEKSEALTKSGRKVSLSLSAKTQKVGPQETHYLILYPEGIPDLVEETGQPDQTLSAEPAAIVAEPVVEEPVVKETARQKLKGAREKKVASLKGKPRKAVKKSRPVSGKQTPRRRVPKAPATKTPAAKAGVGQQQESAKDASPSIQDDYERTLPFLAKVSHEIRTPLNSIIGFSEIMKEEQFGPIKNERYLGYLDDIFVSANHALSLVNDMLDISRIQAGSMEMEREGLDLNEEVHSAIKSMAPQFANKEIHVWQGLSEESLSVLCDKRSLRQIVLNLVSNAVKYTPKGGQITVSTALEKGDKVVLRVRDTGIGMSETDIKQAMKPFQRLDTILRHETNGSGLGLPLTKALIEANKAEFKIESAVDKGTLVSVTFPKI